MRILFATADPQGPQGWWRAHVPAAMLRARGHEAHAADALTVDDRGRMRAVGTRTVLRPARVVILQGWYHPDAAKIIAQARRSGQIILADLDDDVWNIPADNPAHDAAAEWRPHFERILGAVDGVLASTPAVAAAAAAFCAGRVDICRQGLPQSIIPAGDIRVQDGVVRVGWMGKTTYRGADLASIAGHLRALPASVRFVHYGAEPADPGFAAQVGVDPARVDVRPWCHMEQLVPQLHECDVAVIPQVPSKFAEARSNATGLMWAAAGVPFAATPTAEYRELAEAGAGLLVQYPQWWGDNLRALCAEDMADHRDLLAGQGRQVFATYSAEQTIHGWVDAISAHLTCKHERERHAVVAWPKGVRNG